MSKCINEIQLLGNVGNDPEFKTLNNGNSFARISIATSKTYKDSSGNDKTITQWHRIVFWNKAAEIVNKWVKKGDKVLVKGELIYNTFENNDGQKVTTAEINANDIILLSPPQNNEKNNNSNNSSNYNNNYNDLPF